MLSPRRVLLALAVCLLLWLGMTMAAPARREACPHNNAAQAQPGAAGGQVQLSSGAGAESTQTESTFACLLNAVSPDALHVVLHRYLPNRFKDGVYETDHSAMEAVHRENPPLATSLVHIAKRQAGGSNATTSTTSASTSAPPPPPQSTSTTSTPLSSPSTTTTTTSPTASPSTPPSSSTSANQTPSSAPPDKTSPTATKTNSPPSSSSSRSQRPQITTYTSTASDGQVTVVTATTFVNADPAQTTGTQADGSLQTNAAVARARNLGVEAAAGLFLGGLLLV